MTKALRACRTAGLLAPPSSGASRVPAHLPSKSRWTQRVRPGCFSPLRFLPLLFPLPPEGSWRRPPTRVGNPRPRAWRGHGCARSSVVSPPNRSLAAVLCLGDADLPFDIPRPGSSTLKSLGLQRRALWAEKRPRDLSPSVLLPRVSGLASRVSVLRIYALGWVLEDTRKQQTQVDEKRKSKLCC